MSEYTRPLPVIEESARPFWQGLREGRVMVQRCESCGKLRFPAAPICNACRSDQASWVPVSGFGKVWTYTVFHKLYFAGFEQELPYNVAVVALAEGPKLFTNIVGVPNSDLKIGMPVAADFVAITPEVTLLKFRPAAGPRG